MSYGLLADLVVFAHFAFVVFVLAGGFLALRWPRLVWLHVPAAVWGALIELAGLPCPLTPLETSLREAAGGSPYEGSFVQHYLLSILYPGGLTRAVQYALGAVVVAVNAVAYALFWRRRSS